MSSAPVPPPLRAVSLLDQDSPRAFCENQRTDMHPLSVVTRMRIGYTSRQKSQTYRPVLDLILEGDVPPAAADATELDRYASTLDVLGVEVLRESPVQYRMCAVILIVRTSDADNLAPILNELVAYKVDIIGCLTNIATGRAENRHPPMTFRHVCMDRESGAMTAYIALHVNFQDQPGGIPGWVNSGMVRVDNVTVNDEGSVVTPNYNILNDFPTIWGLYFDPDRHDRHGAR